MYGVFRCLYMYIFRHLKKKMYYLSWRMSLCFIASRTFRTRLLGHLWATPETWGKCHQVRFLYWRSRWTFHTFSISSRRLQLDLHQMLPLTRSPWRSQMLLVLPRSSPSPKLSICPLRPTSNVQERRHPDLTGRCRASCWTLPEAAQRYQKPVCIPTTELGPPRGSAWRKGLNSFQQTPQIIKKSGMDLASTFYESVFERASCFRFLAKKQHPQEAPVQPWTSLDRPNTIEVSSPFVLGVFNPVANVCDQVRREEGKFQPGLSDGAPPSDGRWWATSLPGLSRSSRPRFHR